MAPGLGSLSLGDAALAPVVKHRAENGCPVSSALITAERDGYYHSETVVFRTMLSGDVQLTLSHAANGYNPCSRSIRAKRSNPAATGVSRGPGGSAREVSAALWSILKDEPTDLRLSKETKSCGEHFFGRSASMA